MSRPPNSTEVALVLLGLAWTSSAWPVIDAIRDHTPLSDDDLRAELLCFRIYGVHVACRAAVKSDKAQASLLADISVFHNGLTGEYEGDRPSYWSKMLDEFLDQVRTGIPENYRCITELRAIAPTGETLDERIDLYRRAAMAHPDHSELSTALAFCIVCKISDRKLASVASADLVDIVAVASGYLEKTRGSWDLD